ncbi:MAG TPA: RNA polymerase sigma factor [Solirubrobacterales bacterium]|nr:RNA polymerase sigma factor [Solirubrobacterales bacterium]
MSPPPAEQFAARIFMGPALRAQPDRRLVDLVRDGYDAAFEEIVRRYRRPLDRFAAAFVGGHSEDVTQDAFSKALLALRGSEAEIELRPWLYRIVRNTALNELRDRTPATAELSEALPGGRSAAAEVEAREELCDLMDRLQALPEPQRAALVMRELEGLSHDEIAAALGVSGGAARQAIYRARAALREGFGLLLPLPLLRALADHGGEAGAAGGAVALGGGALKAGMATVLIAGAVGAGVAVQDHHGRADGPEAAEAATLPGSRHATASGSARPAAEQSSLTADGGEGRGHRGQSGDDTGGHGLGPGSDDSALANGDRSGGGTSSGGDGSRSGSSGHSGSSSGGPGPSSGSGSSDDSGSGDRHGSRSGSGSDDSGSLSGIGSDDSGSGSDSGADDGGSSGGSGSSGSDDGLVSGSDGGNSGSGSGEVESEPTPSDDTTPTDEAVVSGDSSGSSGSGTSGGGSDDSQPTG